MNHVDGKFTGTAGDQIYWQAWLPKSAPVMQVIISHGLGEHGGRYAEIAQVLVEQGATVYAIDHHGHGHSEGSRANIDRFSFTVDDLDRLIDLAIGREKGCPLYLVGHSMGGAIAVAYAVKHQEKLAGLLLSGAAISLDALPFWLPPLCKILGVLAPNLPFFPIDPALVSRDPDTVRDYATDPLNMHEKIPVRTLAELIKMVEWLPRAVSLLKLPLLVMHGTDDALVSAETSEKLYADASSADKTLKLYEGYYHEILNEPPQDRKVVMRDIADWLQARCGAK